MNFVENIENAVEIIKSRTDSLFANEEPSLFVNSEQPNEYMNSRINSEYKYTEYLPDYLEQDLNKIKKKQATTESLLTGEQEDLTNQLVKQTDSPIIPKKQDQIIPNDSNIDNNASRALIQRQQQNYVADQPEWHAPWKLMRVIAGHKGWIRSIAVEPDNKWFATGSNDNTIKIWDLATGHLKLTLTNHIMAVRDLVISDRHPYMFSCSEDKTVKCWDLERNKVIRDYYGHLSGVYTMSLHPTLDVLVTGSRDSTVRVWDMRTAVPVFTLTGHKNPITQVEAQSTDPQIISASNDKTIRLWDLAAGKSQTVLTQHKKAVRSLALHPTEYSFASASADNIKQWKFPEGTFLQNFIPRRESIVNTISINQDNVMFAGNDDGTLSFYDWRSGYKFQDLSTTNIPGSLDSEAGILTSSFDKTGLRLLTGEADKSIKIWREDPDATKDTHPGIKFNPDLYRQEIY